MLRWLVLALRVRTIIFRLEDIQCLRLKVVDELIAAKLKRSNNVNQEKPKIDQVDEIIDGARKEAGELRRMKHGRADESESPPMKWLMKADDAFQRDKVALEEARDVMSKHKLKTYKSFQGYRFKTIIEKYDPSDIAEYIDPSKFPKE
ncbi:hypothetical protein TRICI_005730 [Trichomonascus ciferrii]|uniref:Uncharacterized protein n=1 Tax=Trichomonascus ciferrii TaxID=44093 RepID=A0A642URQ9_9ASCO|nr:hypothetical protein TRICI_005730 [Trichomonascus ciferrii]